jgi:hypothetical protein
MVHPIYRKKFLFISQPPKLKKNCEFVLIILFKEFSEAVSPTGKLIFTWAQVNHILDFKITHQVDINFPVGSRSNGTFINRRLQDLHK